MQIRKGMRFVGGESAALTRVHEYFWKKASSLLVSVPLETLIDILQRYHIEQIVKDNLVFYKVGIETLFV